MTQNEQYAVPPRNGWDLHCHTVFSDGTQTPAMLIRLAGERGLQGVAITDHDTTSGWVEAECAACSLGLPLVRGTEITTECGHVSVHMLAYQYDPNSTHISRIFAQTREGRIKRAKVMVDRLSWDFPITWEDVLAQIKAGARTTVGRPHIADALVAAGVYQTRSEAFAGAVSASSKYYVPTPSPNAREVVQAIKEAGGVSVIAHPADASRNRILLSDHQIKLLVDEGLDGLEIWHRGNSSEQRRRLLTLAEKYDLLVTGGSDWHGDGKPNKLGENLTDEQTVATIVGRGAIDIIEPADTPSKA
jgi:predicted metal-dependent phosphoesterase TrpH